MIGHNRVILFMALLWVCNGAHHLEASDDMATDNLGESGPSPDEAAKQTEGAATGVQRKINMGVGGYQLIPNFVVAAKAKKVEVENREGCENVCDSHKDCHSFSYRAADKRCMWSKLALHYNSKSSFHMKITKMDDMGRMKPTGKFKRFDNLQYHEKGWRKLVSDQAGCEDLCNKMNTCGAYSYRDYDELCMMSGDAIKFDTDFVYYERNMPPPVDKQEMRMLSGKDEADEADPPAAAIKDMKIFKVAKMMTKKALNDKKNIEEVGKLVDEAKGEADDTEEREARLRDGISRSQKERQEKMHLVKQVEGTNREVGTVKGLGVKTAKEARQKATSQIQTAFQEGYEKAQNKNRQPYDEEVQEIAEKGKVSMEEHTGKVSSIASMMEKEQKEKEEKDTVQREQKAKALETELKAKAVRKVRVESLKKYAADHIQHHTLRAKNEDKLKRLIKIAEKRRKREKARKEMKVKKIALEKKQKHEKKVQDEKERKEKVRRESDVKEEERKHVEYSRKRKEQSHKEIDKKEQIHKRQKKAEELKLKLEQAKKDASELGEKHKERENKIGQCEERRVKGQFVTYAYARTTTFTSAMAPNQKYGGDVEYNGMLRVQNGLGNKKQHAYLKFSATGNKIVDEESEEQTMLGESDSVDEGSHNEPSTEVSPEAAVVSTSTNVVANAANNEIIEKSKATYVARRRWVDRRRRWSVEPVVSDRRRDALASRRRELSERRRRSITALETGVKKAELKVFKFGGPAAKLVVKAVTCTWERPSLDYTSAAKLAIPESVLRERLLSLIQTGESEAVQLAAEDTEQTGYWGQDGDPKILGDANEAGDDERMRRASPSSRPPPVLPVPVPYTADRRRYIDRRRRFPEPKDGKSGETDPTAPPPTDRRRRFVGQTAGTVYAPEGNNMWINIPLSANIVGVMRGADKLCFEITGGGPTEPVVLGSEKSTNKPYLQLNIMGQSGARRRRCSQSVALDGLTALAAGGTSSPSLTL